MTSGRYHWLMCLVKETTPRLEIDGELLARSLTKADPTLAHHLLTTLGIPAGKIARGIGMRGAFVGRFRDPDDGEEGIRRMWDTWLSENDGQYHVSFHCFFSKVIEFRFAYSHSDGYDASCACAA